MLFFDRGTFWVLPLTSCYIPKSARIVQTSILGCHILFIIVLLLSLLSIVVVVVVVVVVSITVAIIIFIISSSSSIISAQDRADEHLGVAISLHTERLEVLAAVFD